MFNEPMGLSAEQKSHLLARFILLTLFFLLLVTQICFGQLYQRDNEPKKITLSSHDPNFKSFPEKSFYKQKENWQYLIDTTWGPGLALAEKQQLFNMFTTSISNSFDGFQSLGMTWASWDSLKNYYYSKIDSTTSRGRFSAIMSYFCSKLRDGHTYCDDIEVLNTPLNPGVPFLMVSGLITNANHFGAVTTVLPDSSVLILRVAENHPLNLEPGDIILGYEGVPWRDLLNELMKAELPNLDWWGGYEGTFNHNLFIGAGMNWHLFDTIDILKYSTGDTIHLSVLPIANLNAPPMLNNEQIEIPNIPFPNYYNGQYVSYGIIDNTNIGYIFTLSEFGTGNSQFDQAVSSLRNTDALIIDMRWNHGGITDWAGAFSILSNESFPTLALAFRCNPSNFTLCPNSSNNALCYVNGSNKDTYDKPIAVLLGPNCISTGDRNAYRLKYLYNVKTFGKPTWATPGYDIYPTYQGWDMRHSTGDFFHVNDPSYYLNRREFPIDYPVWHNRNDVAIGKDAVVEKALDWINNLVYPHNIITDKLNYNPIQDTVHLSTTIENPNSHQLSARAYLKTIEDVNIDSMNFLKQSSNAVSEHWKTDFILPPTEEFYKIVVTVFDETTPDQFTVPNATRFTTAGPIKLDSIRFLKGITNYYNLRPFVRNEGTSLTISNAKIQLRCNDPWVSGIAGSISLPSIASGASVGASSWIAINYYDSIFPGYFNLKAEISVDRWTYWEDSIRVNIITGIDEEKLLVTEFKLEQNYPNPFNPTTTIGFGIPEKENVKISVLNILGEEIKILLNEEKEAGYHSTKFNGSDLPSGVYFYQLKTSEFIQTRKMILIK